jgi:hypothetical protein
MRRFTPLKPSRGTTWPEDEARVIKYRDGSCVGPRVGFPGDCFGYPLEIDHVRASHGMGMKSESTRSNGVLLCGNHHRWKTEHGREARPLLLTYLERVTS